MKKMIYVLVLTFAIMILGVSGVNAEELPATENLLNNPSEWVLKSNATIDVDEVLRLRSQDTDSGTAQARFKTKCGVTNEVYEFEFQCLNNEYSYNNRLAFSFRANTTDVNDNSATFLNVEFRRDNHSIEFNKTMNTAPTSRMLIKSVLFNSQFYDRTNEQAVNEWWAEKHSVKIETNLFTNPSDSREYLNIKVTIDDIIMPVSQEQNCTAYANVDVAFYSIQIEGYFGFMSYHGTDFDISNVKAKINEVPLTVTETVSVIFDLDGGTRTGGGPEKIRVVKGSSVIAPEITKKGYIFNGWDKTFDNITEDIVIKAKWIKDESSEQKPGGCFGYSSNIFMIISILAISVYVTSKIKQYK